MTAVTNVEPSSVPVWRLEQASTGASDVDNWTHLRRPKVAVLSTYPPTKCGLATFAADVEAALASAGAEVRMVAIEPLPTVAMAPPQVLATINKQDRGSYARAANVVNDWNPDAVLVEHEFGIFGGPDGAFVLDFVDQVHVPVFVTLHTVLTHPSEGQRRVLEGLAQRVAGFTVFTETARAAFRGQFGTGATEERPATNIWATRFGIEVIAHGAPVEVCRVPRRTGCRTSASVSRRVVARRSSRNTSCRAATGPRPRRPPPPCRPP